MTDLMGRLPEWHVAGGVGQDQIHPAFALSGPARAGREADPSRVLR